MFLKRLFLLILFFSGIIVPQLFSQTIPTRMDIPNWVKMGMTLFEARNYAPNGLLLPRGENQYFYSLNGDIHILVIDPNKGLTSFQLAIDYNVNSAIEIFTNEYGNPLKEGDNFFYWNINNSAKNLNFVSITIHNNNFSHLNIIYYFSNLFY